jgi:hypothetical protein
VLVLSIVLPVCAILLPAQSINSGTLVITVKDPSDFLVRGAKITLNNPITRYEQSALTDPSGLCRFNSIPQNTYKLTAEAPDLAPFSRDVDVRSSLPFTLDISLKLLTSSNKLDVTAHTGLVGLWTRCPTARPGA